MPDITNLLGKKDDSSVLLTAAWGHELLAKLIPLFNIEFKDTDGKKYPVYYSDSKLTIEISPIAEASTGGGMLFRGLWAASIVAKYQEMWKVPTGAYAGTYVCVNPDGTSLSPWQGVDWVMISQSSGIGNWT